MNSDQIKKTVRENYAGVVLQKPLNESCCAPATGCCSPAPRDNNAVSRELGYTDEEMAAVPEGANLGLGCGNPATIASLKEGEVVVDLGSGAGFDAFNAARHVGKTGRVIGVDMTPEMLLQARENARKAGTENVEFRLGEIEHLPVADNSVDIIISNCVINLSPEKDKVFKDAYRILKTGGRLAISDIVATGPISPEMQKDMDLHSGCISGASHVDEIKKQLADAGFKNIQIDIKEESREYIKDWFPGSDAEKVVVSADIQAVK